MKWLSHLLLPLVFGLGADGSSTDLTRSWQGAWVVRDAIYPGSIQAWSVQGNSVVVYDPTTHSQKSEKFTLESPCRLVRTESPGAQTVVVTTNTFAFASDGLHVGSPQAAGGLRRGPLLTACVGDRVYTFDERTGHCQMQPADKGGSPTPAGACAVSATPPAFVLRRLDGVGEDVWMNFAGDGLLSPALAGAVSDKQPTFDAAIRRADTLAKPNR
jgi:hypothetical protein